jgi:hypothetical protein
MLPMNKHTNAAIMAISAIYDDVSPRKATADDVLAIARALRPRIRRQDMGVVLIAIMVARQRSKRQRDEVFKELVSALVVTLGGSHRRRCRPVMRNHGADGTFDRFVQCWTRDLLGLVVRLDASSVLNEIYQRDGKQREWPWHNESTDPRCACSLPRRQHRTQRARLGGRLGASVQLRPGSNRGGRSV